MTNHSASIGHAIDKPGTDGSTTAIGMEVRDVTNGAAYAAIIARSGGIGRNRCVSLSPPIACVIAVRRDCSDRREPLAAPVSAAAPAVQDSDDRSAAHTMTTGLQERIECTQTGRRVCKNNNQWKDVPALKTNGVLIDFAKSVESEKVLRRKRKRYDLTRFRLGVGSNRCEHAR